MVFSRKYIDGEYLINAQFFKDKVVYNIADEAGTFDEVITDYETFNKLSSAEKWISLSEAIVKDIYKNKFESIILEDPRGL